MAIPSGGVAMLLAVSLLVSGVVVGSVAGCGNTKGTSGETQASAPPTIELLAIPASAQAVIGVDVGKLTESRLVALAVAQMYRRDPGLEKRINTLRTDCGLEPGRDIQRLVIGMRAAPDQVVLIAAGSFEETAVANCLNKIVASGGGTVNGRQVDGHTVYKFESADSGGRALWLAVGGGGVLAVATSEAFLREALGSGEKVWDSQAMKPYLSEVDRTASFWWAGLMPDKLGAGLVTATSGAISKPPVAAHGTLDLADGLSVSLSLVMGSEDDAKTAGSKAIVEMALGALVAQRYGLGRLASKLKAESKGKNLMLSASLTVKDLNQLLSASRESAPGAKRLDTKGPALQYGADQNPGN